MKKKTKPATARPQGEVTYVRLPADVRAAAEARARLACRTLAGEIELALREHLKMPVT